MSSNPNPLPINLELLSLETLERLQKEVEERKKVLQNKKNPGRKPGDLSNDRLRTVVEAHLAIEAQEAAEAGTLGYMARALTLATIPHSKQEGNEFHRRNGAFSMSMLAPSSVGLPYGSQPRLLVAPGETSFDDFHLGNRQHELATPRSDSRLLLQSCAFQKKSSEKICYRV